MHTFRPLKKSHYGHRISFSNFKDISTPKEEFKQAETYPVQNLNNEENEIEARIIEFLSKEEVEMKNPWDKMYDYLDKARKKQNEEESTRSSIISVDKEKSKFSLSCKLYKERIIKVNEKSHSQSSRSLDIQRHVE